MGKRRFAYNLMNPSDNIGLLEREYNMTEHLINHFEDFSYIKNILKDIRDLEKLERSTYLKRITPLQIACFYDDIINIKKLYSTQIKRRNILFLYLQ